MAHRPTPPRHHRRTPNPDRQLHRRVQPPPAPPLATTSRHPGHHLHQPPQSRPSNPHRHPQPCPHRPRRPSRISHPARQRPPAPHRHRPPPPPNPRPDPHPGPPHHRHQRRHRRTPARLHTRPHQGLPTHRRPQRTQTEKTANLKQVRGYSDVLRHHAVPPAGFEPAAFCSGGRRSIP